MSEVIIENIVISNPDKMIFDGISKEDIARYYKHVGKRMLPYLKRRIISTIRCPNGVNGACFFMKHIGKETDGVSLYEIDNDKDKRKDYYYITNVSGIISEVQMNAVEFHPWGSRVDFINKPDVMIFDLDPDENLGLDDLRQGVLDLKSILDELNLVSFLKTSGGKGYHVFVPFVASCEWEEFRNFSKNIALLMEQKWPSRYTSNMRFKNRENKIFIDWIRNTEGSSCVAPYSLRKKNNASVSMPIKWSELYKVTPDEIHIEDAIKRIKRKDPWEGYFDVLQKIS